MAKVAETYDLATPVGKVRFEIPDTNIDNPNFTDKEITYALELANGSPLLAAAHCLEIIAGDPQRLQSWSRGSVSGVRATALELRQRASALRQRAGGEFASVPLVRSDFW